MQRVPANKVPPSQRMLANLSELCSQSHQIDTGFLLTLHFTLQATAGRLGVVQDCRADEGVREALRARTGAGFLQDRPQVRVAQQTQVTIAG